MGREPADWLDSISFLKADLLLDGKGKKHSLDTLLIQIYLQNCAYRMLSSRQTETGQKKASFTSIAYLLHKSLAGAAVSHESIDTVLLSSLQSSKKQ